MREMRAAIAGSCAGEDCGFGARAAERLRADNLGENNEVVEATTARTANAAVKSVRVFVVLDLVVCELVVEFMGDLMSANRITFGCERIRLVG